MQISKDSEFLKSQAIVNYSLIIGGREHTMDDTKLVTLSSPKSNTKILRRKTPSQFSRSIPYSDHSPPNVRPILGSSKLKLPSSTLPTIPNSIPHNYHHRPRNSRRSARSRGNSPTEALVFFQSQKSQIEIISSLSEYIYLYPASSQQFLPQYIGGVCGATTEITLVPKTKFSR